MTSGVPLARPLCAAHRKDWDALGRLRAIVDLAALRPEPTLDHMSRQRIAETFVILRGYLDGEVKRCRECPGA